jgi:flagellin
MPLTINTNMAASRASYFLSKNNDALQKSLDRLSSGKRITQPSDDAGGLAVSMKLKGEIDTLKGAANNVANAISFLQVQDGILENIANIVGRMGELYSMSTDVLQDGSTSYDSEVDDLRGQLDTLATAGSSEFNGVDLLVGAALPVSAGGQTINISRTATSLDSILTSTTGTVDFTTDATTAAAIGSSDAVSEVLANVANLRATNGGEAKRLQFAQDNIATQITNLEAANGRIMDVDIAAETTNLAKQQILVQASASMVAQANSANQVALMLLQ